ncbi:MAG: hypothetical protein A3B38_01760 [Candidatus Levybacteria bacterium RIFCSPLOWO2_01_FULL_36_13]|nr:MAG: hypothetical protein A2684_02995 [Candidatus Levybacteria bacterium RIFCSPHIGHO2_01_FULL_36_15b]OGH35590.1 MAG: hypothetical protein A3B38_01760 [Candidatus Levybacteria bacterium RIFCSPLOWO2_01_FULL_36_13]
MNLFLQLIPNLSSKLNYLISDYVAVSIDLNPVGIFMENLIFASLLVVISYLFGKKIKRVFFRDILAQHDFFVSIALGYVIFSTGITMLGFFSLLQKEALYMYFGIITLVSVIPIRNLKSELLLFKKYIFTSIKNLRENKLVFIGVILFTIVALVNLINPEIREDQYHVDFPRIFIREETIMLPPNEDLNVSGSSMLAEMFYIPGIMSLSKESARHIHFLFYILVLFTLLKFSKLKNYRFAIYTPLIFITAPVVIHETSSMYVDFQWIFLFLLSILLLINERTNGLSKYLLIGILLGGMLATKLWTIVLIPILIVFTIIIYRNNHFFSILKKIISIFTGVILISGIWFVRAYILTGNPFFPAYNITNYFTFNVNLINPLQNLNVFSTLFFLGVGLIIFQAKDNVRIIKNSVIFVLLFILFLILLVINYPYGRYLLSIYVLLIFLASVGLYNCLNKTPSIKLLVYTLVFIIFGYYFLSSVFVLPYTFGIADKNKYLSRLLNKDNSSYYDFDHKFAKFIGREEKIAMYNFHGYYYADFRFIDTNSIFDKNDNSLKLLKKQGISKLMIRGGDIKWFCENLSIKDCIIEKYSLISSFHVYPYYYLYNIY